MGDSTDKRERIQGAAREGRCPECGGTLGHERIGSGQLADGIFCSLECFARFHEDYYRVRITHGTASLN